MHPNKWLLTNKYRGNENGHLVGIEKREFKVLNLKKKLFLVEKCEGRKVHVLCIHIMSHLNKIKTYQTKTPTEILLRMRNIRVFALKYKFPFEIYLLVFLWGLFIFQQRWLNTKIDSFGRLCQKWPDWFLT